MLDELESSRLHVTLVPAPEKKHETHQIRVAFERNPGWYRRLCSRYPSSRKDNPGGRRTRIRRAHILATLRMLIENEGYNSTYSGDLLRFAEEKKESEPF